MCLQGLSWFLSIWFLSNWPNRVQSFEGSKPTSHKTRATCAAHILVSVFKKCDAFIFHDIFHDICFYTHRSERADRVASSDPYKRVLPSPEDIRALLGGGGTGFGSAEVGLLGLHFGFITLSPSLTTNQRNLACASVMHHHLMHAGQGQKETQRLQRSNTS